jgi:hypothetical protein
MSVPVHLLMEMIITKKIQVILINLDGNSSCNKKVKHTTIYFY